MEERERRRGRVGDRPPALSASQKVEVRRIRDEGRSVLEMAVLFKVSKATVRRV